MSAAQVVLNTYELAENVYSFLNLKETARAMGINQTARKIMLESKKIQTRLSIIIVECFEKWKHRKGQSPKAEEICIWVFCTAYQDDGTLGVEQPWAAGCHLHLRPGSLDFEDKVFWRKLRFPAGGLQVELYGYGRSIRDLDRKTFDEKNTLDDFVAWAYRYYFFDQSTANGDGVGLVNVGHFAARKLI